MGQKQYGLNQDENVDQSIYVCPPCDAGKYTGKPGMGSCLECTPGKYQEEEGASGKYTEEEQIQQNVILYHLKLTIFIFYS